VQLSRWMAATLFADCRAIFSYGNAAQQHEKFTLSVKIWREKR